MVAGVGPLAMLSCEPRQIRKEAAAAMDVCAGVRLARATTLLFIYLAKVQKNKFFDTQIS